MKADRRAWFLALVLGVLAVIPYARVVQFDFVWDDPIIFQRQLPYFDSLQNVLFPPKSIPQFGVHYYRPTTILSYQLDEWLAESFWPESERAEARRVVYHASVVFYHGLATVLLTVLACRLLGAGREGLRDPPLAYASAAAGVLVFVGHPLHVESVAWMAGRTDVLCTVFVLAALIAYAWLKRGGGWAAFALSLLFAFAAMLAKETGVVLLGLIPAFDLAFADRGAVGEGAGSGSPTRAERRRRERERTKSPRRPGGGLPMMARWGGLLAVGVAYFLLRADAVGDRTLQAVGEPWSRLFGAVAWYAGKLVWPPPQSAFVHAVPEGAAVWIGSLLVTGGAGALVWLWRRKGWRAEALALLLLGGSLAPSLTIAAFRISETPLAERYGYMPSAGLSLLLAALALRGAERLPGGWTPWLRRGLPVALAVIVAAAGAAASWNRAEVWRNDLAFWTDTVEKAPEQGLPHLHLGMTYADRDRLEEAERAYRKALETYDDSEGRSKAYNNLGALYMRQGRFPEAAEALRGALRQVRDYPVAHYNLGVIELRLANRAGSPAERAEHARRARHNLSRALELNPRYVKANLVYGRLLLQQGETEAGVRHLERTVRLAPSSPQAARARSLLEQVGRR